MNANKLSQKGRTKNKSFMLISFLVIALLFIPIVSAVWWNPFTWFGDDNEIVKDGGWHLSHLDGIQLEYFETQITNLENGKASICLLPKTDLRINNDIIVESKATLKKNNIENGQVEPSDMEVETEGGNVKKMCVDVDYSNEDEIKFGENSALFIFTNESITAYENEIEVGRLSLSTEDFEYKNGKPDIKTGVGTQKLTHTFYIENYDSEAITNLRVIDMDSLEEIERNTNLKYLSYVEVLENVYEEDCEEVTNATGTTEVCVSYINGSELVLREQWNEMTSAISGEDYIVGVFADTHKKDYFDIDFDYYGTSVLSSPINWATVTVVDLVSYYKLDDNAASTTVVDAQGNNTGTASTNTNNLYNASGMINSAFAIANSNDVDTGITINFDPSTTPYTVAAWVNPSSVGATDVIWGSSTTAGSRFYFRMSADGSLAIYLDDGAYATSTTLASAGNWYHTVVTLNGSGGVELFVDGVSEDAGSFSSYTASGSLHIGNSDGITSYFAGTIDEVGIWERELSVAEIIDLFNSTDGSGPRPYPFTGDASPVVTLVSPANESNLTQSSTTFQATITDDVNLVSACLLIDDACVDNETSPVNGSNSFTGSYSEGYHNWSVIAFDNNSQSTTSDVWFFNYTQPPISIDLLSPVDASTSQIPLVNMSCEAYETDGVTELNLVLDGDVNYTVTNSTPAENLTLERLMNFSEGNYTWSCNATNPSTSASSSNRTFEVLYSSPEINLTLPIAYANLTTTNINFTSTVTDVNGISNVTLYIDGVLNETNSSGVSGNYSFNKIVSSGNHNWSLISESIYGKSTTSATREFYIDIIAPVINLTAPPSIFDYLIDGETLNLNWTVSDLNLDSCWHDYYNADNSFFTTADEPTLWLDDNWITGGFYSSNTLKIGDWLDEITLISSRNDGATCTGYSYGYAYINVSNCSSVGGYKYINLTKDESGMSYDFQVFSCDGNVIENKTYTGLGLCLSEPKEILVNKTILNCSENTTTFEYINGYNNITFYANDTFGNVNSVTRNWTSLIGTFSISYENPVYEGYENTITATVEDLAIGSSLTSAVLYYNGTNYSTSINYSGGDYEISATLSAPAVTVDTNYTFGFYVTIDGTVYDPQSNNQTVINSNFGECGGVSNDTILTLNLVDEDTQVTILGDIEIGGEIKSVSSGDIIGTIYTNFTNSSNASLCFSPPSAYDLYYMDAEIRYTSDGYSSELYYIQNADITDDLGNLTLYDLNESEATEFKVTYQDSTYNFVESAIIQLQRRYIAEGVYKTVEAPLTSNEGVSKLHIDLDSIGYRATIVKDGVVLDEFENLVFDCQSELTGECEHKLLGDIDSDNEVNLDNTRDFYYSEPVLSNDSISVSFSIPSGTPSSVNIILEHKDQFSNETLCNTTITSSAGSMSCEYSETLGESYIDFTIYKDGEAMAKKSYIIHTSNYLDWLGNNYIFIFVLLLSLVGMALTSPEWIVINGVVTMVISGGLYLASGLNFVVGLGITVYLVIAAVILIAKMGKQEDR